MRLAPATLDDAEFLFRIRNDPQTRAMSADAAPLQWVGHVAWLERAIADPARQLFIAQEDGPAGSGRIDLLGDGAELSWTVAPERRGAGVGARLLRALIEAAPRGRLIARIKSSNAASLALARRCQFQWRAAAGEIEEWALTK